MGANVYIVYFIFSCLEQLQLSVSEWVQVAPELLVLVLFIVSSWMVVHRQRLIQQRDREGDSLVIDGLCHFVNGIIGPLFHTRNILALRQP